jgi:uncharacterized protein YqhQ
LDECGRGARPDEPLLPDERVQPGLETGKQEKNYSEFFIFLGIITKILIKILFGQFLVQFLVIFLSKIFAIKVKKNPHSFFL